MAENTNSKENYSKVCKPLTKGIISSYYENPWETWKFSYMKTVLKMSLTAVSDDQSHIPKEEELNEKLPVTKRTSEELKKEFESSYNGIKFMWIGHASCLVKVDDVTILTDPIFSQRCSPFPSLGPCRYRNTPCSVKELPHVDAVLISHNHYDHLDKATVNELNEKHGTELAWFVPKGIQSWMKDKCGVKNVQDFMWWEESSELKGVKFVFTPTQHWSGRIPPKDYNQALWGSWTVLGERHRFFFAGDTGYCEAFKEIGEKYGPFDLAAIPIGAYYPREALSCQHVDPKEAIKIHKDIKSKESFGIHWGTFKLTYEHYLEPKKLIKELTDEEQNKNVNFYTVKHGEIKVSGRASIEEATDALLYSENITTNPLELKRSFSSEDKVGESEANEIYSLKYQDIKVTDCLKLQNRKETDSRHDQEKTNHCK